jgi:hypothetical protein
MRKDTQEPTPEGAPPAVETGHMDETAAIEEEEI